MDVELSEKEQRVIETVCRTFIRHRAEHGQTAVVRAIKRPYIYTTVERGYGRGYRTMSLKVKDPISWRSRIVRVVSVSAEHLAFSDEALCEAAYKAVDEAMTRLQQEVGTPDV